MRLKNLETLGSTLQEFNFPIRLENNWHSCGQERSVREKNVNGSKIFFLLLRFPLGGAAADHLVCRESLLRRIRTMCGRLS